MKPYTRSVSLWNIELWLAVAALALASGPLRAQLTEGLGREQTQRLCSDCHELERSISLRQDRDGWKATLNKMISLGAQGTEEEFSIVLDYLSRNYPAQVMPPLNVNKAKAIDLEARLSLRRSEAAAVIEYRAKHGSFRSVDDLRKVPGVDPSKIDRKKDALLF
jgi:competence protein ComEA